MFRKAAYLIALMVLVLTGTVFAQGDNSTLQVLDAAEVPPRDPPELAERLGGVAGAREAAGSSAPPYKLGDRLTFHVGNSDLNEMFEVDAELAASTPGIYMWVELGVDYDPLLLDRVAREIDEVIFPTLRALFGSEPSPGIDGDTHIYILNATNLGAVGGYFNDSSTYPRQVIETSNEHEMFVIAVDNVPIDSSSYINVLAHEFVHMIQHHEDPSEATWVTEGTAELGALLGTQSRARPYDLFLANLYFADPAIQLNGWDIDAPGPYYGGASLFFTYLAERFGPEIALAHSREPADDITGVERALEAVRATDRVTGQPVTFAHVFADWVVANLVNDPRLADGRFGYRAVDSTRRATVLTVYEDAAYPLVLTGRHVNQFGPQYLQLTSQSEQTLAVEFAGRETARVVPAEPHSGDYFYWANRTNQGDARLTRTFDLSQVESATLRFWTWYEMEPFWDYGYLSVSTDGGQTWTVLETGHATHENPNSRAFAAGITGFSGSDNQPRPAPFMGIQFDFASGVVLDVIDGSGAQAAGLQANDRLLAINDTPFAPPDLIQVLDQYQVNDTVAFTILRGDEEIELPLTLGAHPQRTLAPQAHWIEEGVDLTPFVGGEVLVRFEYITDQAFVRNGLVLDDISIPEIDYFDDAESASGGWLAEGWVRIANELPQEFLVEIVQGGPTMTIRRWLMPGEGTAGHWTVAVGPDAPATLIISGMTAYTTQPALYDLTITADE